MRWNKGWGRFWLYIGPCLLDFYQFLREYSSYKGSAHHPNDKLNPPRCVDTDFLLVIKNHVLWFSSCSRHSLERQQIELNQLRREFTELDPFRAGFIQSLTKKIHRKRERRSSKSWFLHRPMTFVSTNKYSWCQEFYQMKLIIEMIEFRYFVIEKFTRQQQSKKKRWFSFSRFYDVNGQKNRNFHQ